MNPPSLRFVFASLLTAVTLHAGTVPDKAVTTIAADHAIYEGSINSGFKTNDVYTDANFTSCLKKNHTGEA